MNPMVPAAERSFTTDRWSVRTVVLDNGEPGFVAADVCRELGHTNPSMALRNANDGGLLDEDEIVREFQLRGDDQRRYNVVTEQGLYSLILASRKPEARAFKRWITHEVLPSIRKTGAYVAPERPVSPLALSRALLDALEAQESRLRAVETRQAEAAAHLGEIHAIASKAVEVASATLPEHVLLSPTDIGAQMVPRRSGRAVNDLLVELGYQWKHPQNRHRTATIKGAPLSQLTSVRDRETGEEWPVLRWSPEIVAILSVAVAKRAAS